MRVLIVRVGAMGDVLHALPAVAALRLAHPEWRIGWAVDPRWEALLAGGGVVDRVHRVEVRDWKRRGLPGTAETVREVLALRREIRAEQYDLAVDLQGTIRSGVVGWMAGAKALVGRAGPRERVAGWLYGRRVGVSAAHVSDQWAEVLSGAVGEKLECVGVELPVDAGAERWADKIVSAGQTLPGAIRSFGNAQSDTAYRFVLIAPSAGWGAKVWPAERYGELALRLGAAGYGVMVNAGRQGDAVARAVVDTSGGTAQAVVCSLAELIALERRASLVIGGDTGPLHLAAVLGRPVVGIFGPTDPARNGPFGAGPVRVLRDAESVTSHSRRAGVEAGLGRIGVAAVVAAAVELLEGAGLGPEVEGWGR